MSPSIRVFIHAMKLGDLIFMISSFAFAVYANYYRVYSLALSGYEFLSMRIKIQNFLLVLGFIAIWHLTFKTFRLYESKRLTSRIEEMGDILKATTLGSILIYIAGRVFNIDLFDGVFLLIFWCGCTFSTLASRIILRIILGHVRRHGRNIRYMLIVGTNESAVDFAKEIGSKPYLGYKILGFVGEESEPKFAESNEVMVVTNMKRLPKFIHEHVVDEIIIALPMQSNYKQACQIVSMCKEQGIVARSLSDIFNSSPIIGSFKKGRRSRSEAGVDSIVTIYAGAMNDSSILNKRIIDFTFSLMLLLFFAPVMIIIALLIKITSKGPAFFVQERIGLNKRRFPLFKFRTMVPDAENQIADLEHLNEVSGPVFKIKDDPRITPIGRILRKTSLDELPQLINVLWGDMSLVGPRPLPLRDIKGFVHDWHRRRFSVRPGITCLWQINGRNNIPFDKWMELDMIYIDNWSIWLDFKILLKTIPSVVKGLGAA